MAKQGRSVFRSDGFLGLLAVLFVLLLHLFTDVFSTLERRFYDFASTSSARQPSAQVAVIAVDDVSIANIGRWPWPRDVHARLIEKLSQANAKTVVHTTFFFEPQVDRGLVLLTQMRQLIAPPSTEIAEDATAPAPLSSAQQQLIDFIDQAQKSLDTDAQLAASLAQSGQVLLPAVFELGAPLGKPDAPLPSFVQASTLADPGAFALPAVKGLFPIEQLGVAAAGIGHLNQFQDVDGAMRQEPLLVNYYGQAMPSVALLAVMKSLNLAPADIRLQPGEAVQLGKLRIATDAAALMRPQFYKDHDGKSAFAPDSFYDVLSGKIAADKYAGKIVIIGATAAGVGTLFPVPGNPALSPAQAMAHVISSILSEHFIVQPTWVQWATPLVWLSVALYLVLALPRLSAAQSALVSLLLGAALLLTEFGLFVSSSLWLPLVFPVSMLLLGYLTVTTKRFLFTEAGKIKSDEESAETNRMMGLALQGQGQLDMAFDRFRRVPLGSDVMDNLYNLALDFERKRQFNKAETVYQHMAAHDPKYKDLQAKLNRAKNLAETVILGGSGSHPGGTLVLDSGAVEKPMLGRYQVVKELGKGAMGVVYLGKDPKIGREVAIKTLALSAEFEGSELVEARERFFREAETAGRLQHQNIVTIFDAGEEHDLAFIAMEFLHGQDLTRHCRVGQLLPVPLVLSIVARVAQALAYAHKQHVVHRDIKPANIMYETDTDTVKVTDFGIARITDSSKTKTGLVLGTPSYMSPEQLAGKRVDGRSDLYSLGVMLFQMLTGDLPFKGESMTELMFKIANEPAPDVLQWRPELDLGLAAGLQRCLSKQPEARFQDGEALAQWLHGVVTSDASAPRLPVPGHPALGSTVFEPTQQFEKTQPAFDLSHEPTQTLQREATIRLDIDKA